MTLAARRLTCCPKHSEVSGKHMILIDAVQCSWCHVVAYCSEKCQRHDWNKLHREECSRDRVYRIGASHLSLWTRFSVSFRSPAQRGLDIPHQPCAHLPRSRALPSESYPNHRRPAAIRPRPRLREGRSLHESQHAPALHEAFRYAVLQIANPRWKADVWG